ncbi:MAG: hypothetical protein RLZZ373_3080 [Pseudomonadota bacterium]|jgi:hypothetical protein
MFRFFPAAALALVALPAIAQTGDPTDPGARVRPLVHRSTLVGRTAPGTPEVADWRTTNERVRAVGGWKAYLKQVQAPDPAPTPEAVQ